VANTRSLYRAQHYTAADRGCWDVRFAPRTTANRRRCSGWARLL